MRVWLCTIALGLTLTAAAAGQGLVDEVTASLEYARANQTFVEMETEIAESNLKAAQTELTRKQKLFAEGLIARIEFEKAAALARESQSLVEFLRQQHEFARQAVARAEKDVELAKSLKDRPTVPSPTLIAKHYGRGLWSQQDLGALARAFRQQFNQELPISALGQTPTHDRLGFNHHQRMDVAVQPDSLEGQWVMEYLQDQGIPYIAFRGRVAGCATGAHIHVGLPSPRL
jgi:hypothetical protein